MDNLLGGTVHNKRLSSSGVGVPSCADTVVVAMPGDLTINLLKIRSKRKRREVLQVLYDPDPVHYRRIWLVGFLSYVGYDRYEIYNIIRDNCKWLDFSQRITYYQIGSVLRSKGVKPAGTEELKHSRAAESSSAISSPKAEGFSRNTISGITDYLENWEIDENIGRLRRKVVL